ncbi:hypothetical protein NSK_007952 [Nannochloropsis salina CCMP1776]|uniref:Uncharacterized protein n=1 Tax=Nannochloropsis salina CCMP1776 TaxID=1027361 RepID=A0A4D9CT33_9STRA|nr:hypothetical protein NSK_007952 [Nannochloropsis salina CCMP1776]|eukprot:TFJ80775.1 hypothetical protein NSK_007952 [Nannochloropsis salina CCMP1776]
MRQLGQILAENEVLHTLSFTDADFSSTCAIPSVALSESTEQKDALCVFTKEIKQNLKSSALRHLVLRHCNLTIDHVTALVDCLSYLPHFAGGSLDLSDNALGPEIALVLSKLLRAQNGPGLLNLGRNNLGDAGAAGLGGMFAADLSAESTSSSSPFASAACPEVGSVIRAQTEASMEQAFPAKDYLVEHGGSLKRNDMLPWTFHLTSLDLSYNGLGDDGLAELVRGVRVYADLNAGCPLKQLVLDGNLITDEGVMGHIHGLFPPASPGSKLKQLGLAHNKLRDDGFHAISEVVGAEGGHVALESLDLRGNQVTAEGLQSLSLMLGEPTALMELAITLPPLHPTSLGDTVAHKGNAQEQYLLQAAVFELVNTATTSQTLTSLKLEGSRRYLTEEMAHSIMRLEAHLVANQSKFKSGRAGRGKEADQGKAPGKKAKEDCAKAQPSKTQDARHVSFSVAEKPRYQDQLAAEHSALHLIQQSQISAIKSQCPPTMHRPSLSAANTSLASTPQSASFTSGTGKKSAGFHDNHVDCIGKPPIVKEKLTVGGDEEDDLPITARATGKSFLSKARPGLSTSRCDKTALHQVSSDMDGSDGTEMIIHQEVAPLLLPLACEAPPLLPPSSSPASNGQEAHQPTISVTQLLCMDGQQSVDRAPTSNASVRTAPPPLPDPRLPPPTSAQGGSWSHFESAGAFPRVAHRHLYLWLDQKISELPENEAKRVKAVGRLDSFYEEVNRANAANTLYDAAKLKEFVAKPSPYSLLLFQEKENGRPGATGGASVASDAVGDGEKEREEGLIATGLGDQLPRKRRRQGPSGLSSTSSSGRHKGTLNLSTNVLKRWNRSNGMINWFLWRLGRAPPAMEEVLQLARMHAARALLKKSQGPRSTLAKGEVVAKGEGKGEGEARAWRRKEEGGREGGEGMEGKEGAAEREMSGAEQKLEGEGGAGEGQRSGKGSAGWEREEGDQEGWAGGREGGSLSRRKARPEKKGQNGGERKKAAALNVAPTLDGEGVKSKGRRREGWRKGGRKGAGRGGEEDEERQAGDRGIEGTAEEDEEGMGGCREEGGTGESEGARGPPEGQAAGERWEEATVGGAEGSWRGARPEAPGHIGQRGNEAAPPPDLDSISTPSPPAPSPRPSLSLPPVPARDTAALYSTLKARHAQMGGSEGLSLEAIEIAVREGFWKRMEGAGEGGSVGEGGEGKGKGEGGGMSRS